MSTLKPGHNIRILCAHITIMNAQSFDQAFQLVDCFLYVFPWEINYLAANREALENLAL